MTVDNTTNIVARLELNLVLDVEIDNTHDTVRCKQVGERVDDGVELRDHGKTVAHSQEVCTNIVDCTAFVECALANAEDCAFIIEAFFVVTELESASILADDLDVLPAEASESGSGDLAQRGREIDEVDGVEEARDGQIFLHLLNVPAGATTNILQAKIILAQLFEGECPPRICLTTQIGLRGY